LLLTALIAEKLLLVRFARPKLNIQTLISAPQKRTNVTPIGSQPSDGSNPAGRTRQDETGNSYVVVGKY